MQKHQPTIGIEPRSSETHSGTSTELLPSALSVPCHQVSNNRIRLNNKLYFGARAVKITQNQDDVRETVIEKSRIILEQR